jgi:hypothetical protein
MFRCGRIAAIPKSIADNHIYGLMRKARGVTTLTGIAEELNRQKWATARGGTWDAKTVSNILKRRKQGQ